MVEILFNCFTAFLQTSGLSETVVVNMTSNCTDSKPSLDLINILEKIITHCKCKLTLGL